MISFSDIHVLTGIFFLASAAHRALHSFPTRRSSDLHETCSGRAISGGSELGPAIARSRRTGAAPFRTVPGSAARLRTDRKSTRLNSSHLGISYAVFCLKKKNCAEDYSGFHVRIEPAA